MTVKEVGLARRRGSAADCGGRTNKLISYPLRVPSVSTRVLETGAGDRALIFLHGAGARADRWRHNLLPVAAAGFHAYAIDFPGHGFAEKGSGPDYSVRGFAKFVLEAMDRLKVPRAAIVGTSLGGHVAARIALDAPNRVDSLVLVGPLGLAPVGATARRNLAEAIVDVGRKGIERKLHALVHDDELIDEAWIEEEWRINNSTGAAEAFRRLGDYFAARIDDDVIGPQLREGAPGIRSLLVWGSDDVLVPTALAPQALNALPPGTDLVTLVDAGHAPYLEQPDRFNSAITEFLTQS